jgi:hypothetical protein
MQEQPPHPNDWGVREKRAVAAFGGRIVRIARDARLRVVARIHRASGIHIHARHAGHGVVD